MNLSDTIEPKSDQLNADDLVAGPITVTVTGVSRGTPDQPVQIALEGRRPYRPCKSMRRVLIAAWGDDGRKWVGRRMRLYCDPAVKFGGVAVGGIRISHLSDISERTSFLLTTTRSKRAPFTVEPLARSEYPGDEFEANLPKWRDVIASGRMTVKQIIDRASEKGELTDEQKAQINVVMTVN